MESSPFTPVRPTRPAAPWIGGKRNLAKRLVTLIEQTPHKTYAEPFVGMGGVFLRRRSKPSAEVINDLSRDVSNFYRILQVHYVAFLDMLRFQITTRAEFERLVAVDPETLTDLQRAARFLYLQRTSFGGKVTGQAFGVSLHQPGRFDVTKLASILEELHERLAGVIVERLPFQDFLKRYDSPETLFYLDPPYWASEDDYGADLFEKQLFWTLQASLRGLRGRFILSINDVPQVRELFKDFDQEAVETTYGIMAGGQQKAAELIVTGGGAGSVQPYPGPALQPRRP